jgi:hypothetical protein
MTKSLFTVLCLLFCAQLTFANKIDELKTNEDVANFLSGLVIKSKKDTRKILILPTDTIIKHFGCDTLAKTWNIKSWEKLDINNDGLTDLLFILDGNSFAAVD